MKPIFLSCFLQVLGATFAMAQDSKENMTLRYIAEVNEETGNVELVPVEKNFDDMKFSQSGGFVFDEQPNSSFAYFDPEGNLEGVYPAPITTADKEFIFSQIDEGGSIKKVNFFGRSPSLPTAEEVKMITEQAINSTLELVCSSKPRPEEIGFNVSLAVALGLEGKLEFSGTWRPQRDCDG
ncbi:hypothetical protein [Roseovarius sp. 2305UL8-3]|uniref:hypothetical protein n=1 Tax=Roseovarius conchicola TaxID=3121636 RepID=UPI003529A87B